MWLEVLDGEGAGERVELRDGARIVLGRGQGCDLVVRDVRASREHAEVLVRDGRVSVRDLGSSNGLWRGEDRVAETVLTPGDEVRVGSTRLALRAETAAPIPATAPTPSVFGVLLERSARRAGRATAIAAAALAAAAVAVVALLVAADEDPVPEVVAGARASVLRIEVTRDGARAAVGSGWVLDAREGLVVTAAHVINEGDGFTAALDGATPRKATIVGVAPCDDVAVLRIEPGGLKTLPLGSQGALAAGEAVVALGFPATALTASAGVVAVPRATLSDPAPDLPVLRDAVQTDTAIGPGSSGGPLVGLDGRLVGMSAMARTSTAAGRDVQGQNFAVGADRLRAVLSELREGRSPAWTGLTFGYPSADDLARDGLPSGVWVTGALRGEGRELTGRLLVGVEGRELAPTLASVCDALTSAGRTAALTLVAPGDAAAPRVVQLPLA